MNDQQFAQLLEKLDWIGYTLEEIRDQQRETNNYPTRVEIVERKPGWR